MNLQYHCYSSIVEVSMNKIALWIRVNVDDWTAERTIIASNDSFSKHQIQFMYFHLRMEWNMTLIYVSFVIRPNSGLFTESFNGTGRIGSHYILWKYSHYNLSLYQYRDWDLLSNFCTSWVPFSVHCNWFQVQVRVQLTLQRENFEIKFPCTKHPRAHTCPCRDGISIVPV